MPVSDCGQLRRVNISAPRLQSLNVSGSGGLRELVVDCPVLTTLIASQCRKLDELGPTFVAPLLTTLNMFGCRALRPDGMPDIIILIIVATCHKSRDNVCISTTL